MKKFIKITLASVLALATLLAASCGNGKEAVSSEGASSAVSEAKKTTVRIATLSGPTGIGMAQLFELSEKGESKNDYEISIFGDPFEIVGKVANGDVDIACVPTNVAANIYKKTSGKTQLAAINTLGVLHILDATGEINSISDLENKTIYATGEGSTPEFALNYVLEQNGLRVGENVNVVYKSEHSELATLCISGQVDIALLPEPFVTNVMTKTDRFNKALNISTEWEAVSDGTVMAMGGIIVTKKFVEENPEAFDKFMEEYEASVELTNSEPATVAALVEKHGILPSAAVAEKAIPNCNIVFITGEEMKTAAKAFYEVLYAADPTSVGGSIPVDDLYLVK